MGIWALNLVLLYSRCFQEETLGAHTAGSQALRQWPLALLLFILKGRPWCCSNASMTSPHNTQCSSTQVRGLSLRTFPAHPPSSSFSRSKAQCDQGSVPGGLANQQGRPRAKAGVGLGCTETSDELSCKAAAHVWMKALRCHGAGPSSASSPGGLAGTSLVLSTCLLNGL